MGRSGQRVERGVKASGLSGEQFNDGTDPRRNNFVQRSWLYHDDPSLKLRRDGVPQATDVNYLSLNVGGSNAVENMTLDEKLAYFNTDHRAKPSDLRFNPTAPTGYKIFQDDEYAPEYNLKYHYKMDTNVSDQTWEWRDE